MSLRTANIEVSLQRLSILRIEHPQANPLKLACTLRAGETLPSALTITAEIHTSRNVAAETTPLAATTITVGADATSFDIDFTSAQANQTVTPDSTRALWLVVYGVGDADQLYTFAAADLLLGWHAISTVTPAPPATAVLLEKGGVAWASGREYVSGTVVTVGTTAYVATADNTSTADDEPGVGVEWESFWVVLSGGGGGGATNLTTTVSPTGVTIVSSTGTDATIPAADETNAGVLTSAFWSKLNDLPTNVSLTDTLAGKVDSFALGDLAFLSSVGASRIDTSAVTEGKIASDAVTTTKILNGAVTVAKTSGFGSIATQASNNVSITGGTITGTTVSGVTISGTSTPTLAVTGTTAVAGTNTGDQTITLTGDVTGSGTGSFAATLANSGVTAGSYIRATITVDAKGRVTAASSNTAGEINGTSGAVDNAITRADGTGGSAVQGSSIAIDDETATTQQNVAIRNVDPATNSSIVITPKGTGAFIVGPKPDGGSTGGGVRGTNAVDLQTARTNLAHIASGVNSFVGAGSQNAATAAQSATIGGVANVASSAQGVAHGVRGVSNRLNMMAHGNSTVAGECQAGRVIMRRTTTDATPVQLSMDGAAPTGATITTSTHFILANNQALSIGIRIIARSATGANHARFLREVVIHRDANAASTTVDNVSTPDPDFRTAGASTWDVSITALATATEGGLLITVTGAASTTIAWGASVEFMEIIRT